MTFQPDAKRQCVKVPIVNDDDLENEEKFTLTLTTVSDRVKTEPDTTTVVITDDDGKTHSIGTYIVHDSLILYICFFTL